MTIARLNTEFWVRACVRRADIEGIPIVVAHKGDPVSGSVLVKRSFRDGGCTVLAQTRDLDGNQAWYAGTGPAPVDEAAADAYVERCRSRDRDLWVLEIDDRDGRLPFDAQIISA